MFAARMFAPRYFAKAGADLVVIPGTKVRRLIPF